MPSLIRLVRRPQLADSLRAYLVMLDVVVVGKIRNGETLELSVDAGPHRLQLAIQRIPFRTTSRVVEFRAGVEGVAFECGPTLTAAGAAMLGASASQPVAAGRAGALLWAIAFTLRHRRDDPWIRLVARVSETDEAKGSREDERSAYVRMMDAVDGRD